MEVGGRQGKYLSRVNFAEDNEAADEGEGRAAGSGEYPEPATWLDRTCAFLAPAWEEEGAEKMGLGEGKPGEGEPGKEM